MFYQDLDHLITEIRIEGHTSSEWSNISENKPI